MVRKGTLRLVVAVLVLSAWACERSREIPADALVIRNVNVVDVATGSVTEGRTVIIEGPRIAAIGPADGFADGSATVIDGSDRYLIPGLWDMHTHIFNNNSVDQPPNEWYFPLMIAHGVTTVRDMWVRPVDAPRVAEWNSAVRAGDLVGPVVAEFGTILDGPGSSLMADRATTPEQARAFVREYADAGADFVKTYTRLSPESYQAIHDEAATHGLAVLGHVPKRVKASMASDLGARSIEHLDGFFVEWSLDEDSLRADPEYSVHFEAPHALARFDSARAAAVIETMARNGTWQVPTLALWSVNTVRGVDEVTSLPVHELVPEWERAEWGEMAGWMDFRNSEPEFAEPWAGLWRLILKNVKTMHDAGVPFLAGTDIGNPFIYPGHSIHDELAGFVEAGLSPAEALRTATLNPAIYLSANDSLGIVEPGAVASLVLLGANPLEDIEHVRDIVAVIQQGRLFDREALEAMMR